MQNQQPDLGGWPLAARGLRTCKRGTGTDTWKLPVSIANLALARSTIMLSIFAPGKNHGKQSQWESSQTGWWREITAAGHGARIHPGYSVEPNRVTQ